MASAGTTPSVRDQLERLSGWSAVSRKRDILAVLGVTLSRGERIAAVLEGFYAGPGSAPPGAYGVLCVTDRRIVFAAGDGSRPPTQEVRFGEIISTDVESGFSAYKLLLVMAHGVATHASTAGLDAITDFVHAVRAGCADALRSAASAASPTEPAAPEFLFREAKRIARGIEEAIAAGANPADLRNDLRVVLALALDPDVQAPPRGAGWGDGTLIFVGALEASLRGEDVEPDLARHVRSGDSFPAPVRGALVTLGAGSVRRLDALRLEIARTRIPDLVSLRHLGAADRARGGLAAAALASWMREAAQCLAKADGGMSSAEADRLRGIATLIRRSQEPAAGGAAPQTSVEQPADQPPPSQTIVEGRSETLENVLAELNRLVGMDNIKTQVKTLVNLIRIQKEREQRNLPVSQQTLHAVFSGPPGTGKTTIARLLGRILRCLGILTKGHLVETDRAGLVAGYVGQTAIRVDETIARALDGVLFVDEAYALSPDDSGKDFGQEAVNTLLKRMEDHRDRIVVIAAGYTDKMKAFIDSNPGLRSRFARHFTFEHFRPRELLAVFELFCEGARYMLTAGARARLEALFTELHADRDDAFGNGRLARNLFERVVERQADRIVAITPLTETLLCSFTEEDIPGRSDLGALGVV
jgi:Holliday junction resolvasome RuvABC ATP-dependent DNA helicase subunit